MSYFEQVGALPEDPILQLPIDFAADSRPNKVNVGIGVYQDEEGRSPVLSSIKKAEKIIFEKGLGKDYFPIEGDFLYNHSSLELLLGSELDLSIKEKIFSAQAVGGTSALRIGADFLTRNVTSKIFIPEISWPNHRLLFSRAGFHLQTIPYYDQKNRKIDFSALCRAIEEIPSGSAILLHGCCHNPTGCDPTEDQWKELLDRIQGGSLIPFIDLAYQGFGRGVEEDAWVVRELVKRDQEFILASSYSKNFGLYGERAGFFLLFSPHLSAIKNCGSQIKKIIRSSYSNPPIHGAHLVTTILQSKELKEGWLAELEQMRLRIVSMRKLLVKGLQEALPDRDFNYLQEQLGMFSLTGLNSSQVVTLREEKGIYMPADGRINVLGLNSANLSYFIEALAPLLQNALVS